MEDARRDRRRAAGSPAPGPVAGLLAGAALGASIFLLAAFVRERWLPGRGPAAPPAGFVPGVEARIPVRVLVSLDGPGPGALLLPLREDGGPSGGEEAILDGALFPRGPGRTWARLLVNHPGGGEPLLLPLGDGAVLLETPGGPVANEALAPHFAARAPSLPPHRLLDLRVARVPDASVEVPAGGFVRVLLAFPPGTDLRAAGGATVAGIRLLPRELPADRIRTALLDGRLAGLGDAARAEAPGGRAR